MPGLDVRSRAILKEIIRVHVDTGRPVSSRTLFKSNRFAPFARLDPQHHGRPDRLRLPRAAPHLGRPRADRPGLPHLHRRADAPAQGRRRRPGAGGLGPRSGRRRRQPPLLRRLAPALAALGRGRIRRGARCPAHRREEPALPGGRAREDPRRPGQRSGRGHLAGARDRRRLHARGARRALRSTDARVRRADAARGAPPAAGGHGARAGRGRSDHRPGGVARGPGLREEGRRGPPVLRRHGPPAREAGVLRRARRSRRSFRPSTRRPASWTWSRGTSIRPEPASFWAPRTTTPWTRGSRPS